MIHTIQSDTGALKVDISSVGAELCSIYSNQTDREYLWQGDPAWWSGRAPILFPIVGSVKDGVYAYNAKNYSLPKHGFVRGARFTAAEASISKIVLEYSSNEETYKLYPFAFLFQAIFELTDNTLSITYRVKNLNNFSMYFSLGSHEAYCCPREDGEAFDDYYLEFEKNGTYISETVTNNGLISGEIYTVIENGKTIPLKYDLFANDALIFKNVISNRIFLKSTKTAAFVEIYYQDAPHLGIWTKIGAPFICIEPWYGMPDDDGHDGSIENKYGIITLDAHSDFAWTHTITIHENLE